MVYSDVVPGLKKTRQARKLQFSDRGDYECSKFQLSPLISPKKGGSVPNLVFFDQNCPTRRQYSDSPKLGGGGQLPPAPSLPRCLWQYTVITVNVIFQLQA